VKVDHWPGVRMNELSKSGQHGDRPTRASLASADSAINSAARNRGNAAPLSASANSTGPSRYTLGLLRYAPRNFSWAEPACEVGVNREECIMDKHRVWWEPFGGLAWGRMRSPIVPTGSTAGDVKALTAQLGVRGYVFWGCK
jgi:hypothetical protein